MFRPVPVSSLMTVPRSTTHVLWVPRLANACGRSILRPQSKSSISTRRPVVSQMSIRLLNKRIPRVLLVQGPPVEHMPWTPRNPRDHRGCVLCYALGSARRGCQVAVLVWNMHSMLSRLFGFSASLAKRLSVGLRYPLIGRTLGHFGNKYPASEASVP
jgi:hypothetical protein